MYDTGTSPKTPFISTHPNRGSSGSHAAPHDIPPGFNGQIVSNVSSAHISQAKQTQKTDVSLQSPKARKPPNKKAKPDKAIDYATILLAQKTWILVLENEIKQLKIHLSLSKHMFLKLYLLLPVWNPIEHTPMYAQPHRQKLISYSTLGMNN